MSFTDPPEPRLIVSGRQSSPFESSLAGNVARALALAAGGYIAIRIALALLHLS